MHTEALVLDGHADTPQRFLDEGWSFTDPAGRGMLSLAEARRGNLAGQFFAVWVDPDQYPMHARLPRALALADAVLEQVRRNPGQMRLCLTPDELLAARRDAAFGVVLAIEGGDAIAGSLANLRVFHRLGVRSMTLTWSHNTPWADSSGDAPCHGGLTSFGREVVREMNRLGMIVDVSHAADSTFSDVLNTTRAPVIASHSSARALTHASRNLTDDQLRTLAGQGGVAMVNYFPAFLDEGWRLAWEASRQERNHRQEEVAAPYRATGSPVPFHVSNVIDREFAERLGPPPLSALIEHIEHMLSVAGVNHVGLGSDFDGIPMAPAGLETAAGLPAITSALLARGHGRDTIHKLLGGNLVRVWREIEAAAG